MSRKKTLRKKQLAVIDALFDGGIDEQTALDKHGIRSTTYHRWYGEELFRAELGRRIAAAQLQSRALMAKHCLAAARKLVKLTESQNPETARKACLDIICPHEKGGKADKAHKPEGKNTGFAMQPSPLKPEVARRLLAALAEEKTIFGDINEQYSKDR
jgi:hypothetical protein